MCSFCLKINLSKNQLKIKHNLKDIITLNIWLENCVPTLSMLIILFYSNKITWHVAKQNIYLLTNVKSFNKIDWIWINISKVLSIRFLWKNCDWWRKKVGLLDWKLRGWKGKRKKEKRKKKKGGTKQRWTKTGMGEKC